MLLPFREKKYIFQVVEESPDPEWTLLWYLRRKLHMTGTKYGCGEGGCGACTVMVSQYVRDEDRVKYPLDVLLILLTFIHLNDHYRYGIVIVALSTFESLAKIIFVIFSKINQEKC